MPLTSNPTICYSLHTRDEEYPVLNRQPSYYNPLDTYTLAKGDQKHYQQQYGDMYFLRLAKLKPAVEAIADEEWRDFEVYGATYPSCRVIKGL